MAKNKLVKDITINKLAEIINKGFDGQMEYMGKEFSKTAGRFDKVEKDLAIIKSQLAGVVYKPDFDKLESRVDYLENILALKKN